MQLVTELEEAEANLAKEKNARAKAEQVCLAVSLPGILCRVAGAST